MARNLVTRTVHGTQVSLKVVDKATEQIVEDTVILSKKFVDYDKDGNAKPLTKEDSAKLKKAVEKALDDSKILVSIGEVVGVDKCYGVPVAQFMELAVEIDPKTRTALATDDAAEDTEE